MYEAYATEILTTTSKFDCTSVISCHKHNKILVGSKQGHLLSINQSLNDQGKYDIQLSKSFEKKAVTDLKVIEELDLVICLSEGALSTHKLNDNYKTLNVFNKYKAISSFGCYVEEQAHGLHVLICAKKKLYLLKWFDHEFDEVQLTFSPNYLADNAAHITWIGGHSVLFAAKNEYQYCRIIETDQSSTSSTTEVGNVRSIAFCPDSLAITSIDKNRAALINGNVVTVVDDNGIPDHNIIRFSETLVAIVFDNPYLVALTNKSIVEVRSLNPSMLIQKISLINPFFITNTLKPGNVIISSINTVWKLNSRPLVKANVDFLVNENYFDLAVALADNTEGFDPIKLIEIKQKTARNLFNQRKFTESFQIHFEINTEVILVIHYLPFLIPEKFLPTLKNFKQEIKLFEPNGDMAENERKLAINALGDFLSAKRTALAMQLATHKKSKQGEKSFLGPKELRKTHETLQLVDSTLLKCYLKAKPMLVSSLLRLSDNSCVLEEAERDLLEMNRSNELLILYEKKKQHRKALQLLKVESSDESSMFWGPEPTIDYLRTLEPSSLPLIFEYAEWVLAKDLEMGLKIFFSEEQDNVHKWDFEQVLNFLRKEEMDAVIPYLEFIIDKWGEKRPKFHEALAEQYIIKVKKLMKDYIHALSDNESFTRAGQEDGQLGEIRRKLLQFLQDSTGYSPQKVLSQLDDHLIEEKAIVFGRLKRHEEALAIYTNLFRDFEAAEKHCLRYYSTIDPVNSTVFFMLFKLYTKPSEVDLTNLNDKWAKNLKPNVNEALKLLRNHADKMDTVNVIRLIPRDASLRKVWTALEAIIDATKTRSSHLAILLAISKLAREKSEAKLSELKSVRVDMKTSVECVLCKKRIGSSFTAFVRYPQTGQLAHFGCHQKPEQAEVTPQLSSSPSFTTLLLKKQQRH